MTTSLTLVEPAEPVVTLEDTKQFLHVWHDDDDALITALIASATDKLDGADGILGRALGRQKWKLTRDGFPPRCIHLPLPPLHTVDSVSYISKTGETVTVSDSDYRYAPDGRLFPAQGWPETIAQPASVVITFTAGYETVPPSIAQALMALVFFWYENRGSAAAPTSAVAEMPFGFDDVLTQWKVPSFG